MERQRCDELCVLQATGSAGNQSDRAAAGPCPFCARFGLGRMRSLRLLERARISDVRQPRSTDHRRKLAVGPWRSCPAFARTLRSRPPTPLLRSDLLGPGPSLLSLLHSLFGHRQPEPLGFALLRFARSMASHDAKAPRRRLLAASLAGAFARLSSSPIPRLIRCASPTELRAWRVDSRSGVAL